MKYAFFSVLLGCFSLFAVGYYYNENAHSGAIIRDLEAQISILETNEIALLQRQDSVARNLQALISKYQILKKTNKELREYSSSLEEKIDSLEIVIDNQMDSILLEKAINRNYKNRMLEQDRLLSKKKQSRVSNHNRQNKQKKEVIAVSNSENLNNDNQLKHNKSVSMAEYFLMHFLSGVLFVFVGVFIKSRRL